MKKVTTKFKSILLLATFALTGCEDFVDIDEPITETSIETVFSLDESAEAAILGIYSSLIDGVNTPASYATGRESSLSYLTSLSADDLEFFLLNNTEEIDFFENSIIPDNRTNLFLWAETYGIVYQCNSAINGLNESTTLTEIIKDRLLGEAKFIRAFTYFNLVNLYGEVPLILGVDTEANRVASRGSVGQVYDQIILDLTEAIELLPLDYTFSNDERTRATVGAATAVRARVYLYLGDWANAEFYSGQLIENSADYSLVADLNGVFLANSTEAILQLAPDQANAWEGFTYFIPPGVPLASLRQALTDDLVSTFEVGDNRLINWLASTDIDGTLFYYPFKYKATQFGLPITEYSMVLRLSEQYLIRAEARAMQGDIVGAQSDLNVIRNRAGLDDTLASTQEELMDAIVQERRVELFTEWGHRWFDLKRTNRADSELSPLKADWQSTDALYPIPFDEINLNPNLDQNTGY